jgi:hypothetical protein
MSRAKAQKRKERRKHKDIIKGATRGKSVGFWYFGCICGFNFASLPEENLFMWGAIQLGRPSTGSGHGNFEF